MSKLSSKQRNVAANVACLEENGAARWPDHALAWLGITRADVESVRPRVREIIADAAGFAEASGLTLAKAEAQNLRSVNEAIALGLHLQDGAADKQRRFSMTTQEDEGLFMTYTYDL